MLAILLTLSLFSFWTLLGVCLITALRVRLAPLRQLLLAPVVGVVLTVLPLSLLSRFGFVVGNVAHSLTVVLLIACGLVLLFARPAFPWRRYGPFAACLVGGLLLTGWPMLEFGFDWLSLCNPDMANYCLGAIRFSHNAFFDVPAAQDLVRGTDYSLYYWFLYVPQMQRSGCETLLAWVMSLTGLTPHEAFMPLILAFHLVLISATGALVYVSRRAYGPALVACAMLGASALTTFGTLYQLIAQVIGLGVLAGAATLLLRHLTPDEDDELPTVPASPSPTWRRLLPEGLLLGVLGAGVILLYPEVAPMLAAAWALYLVRGVFLMWKERRAVTGAAAGAETTAPAAGTDADTPARRVPGLRATLTVGALALVTFALLMWQRAVSAVLFLLGQVAAGSEGTELQRVYFPFYLLPSGLANVWGFLPLARVPLEPFASFAIFFAALFLLAAVLLCAWSVWRGQPVAMVAAVMLVLAVPLFARGASFGLYKLAMFIQPFLLGSFVVGWLALTRGRKLFVRALPLVLLAVPSLYVQQQYVQSSRAVGRGLGFGELPGGSHTRINDEFRRLIADASASAGNGGRPPGVIADSYNAVLAMFQAAYTRRLPAAFPSAQIGTVMVEKDWWRDYDPVKDRPTAPDAIKHRELSDQIRVVMEKGAFDLKDPREPGAANPFIYRAIGPPQPPDPASLFVAAGASQSVYNRWHRRRGGGPDGNFHALPLRSVRDHLVFVESERGKSYYMNPRNISLYQLEPDPMYPDKSMAAGGQHFLFQVVNPSPKLRMVVELTSSLAVDGENRLPPAEAIGAGRAKFDTSGRGAMRVFSEPLSPQEVNGRTYVALDMAAEAKQFRPPRRALMALYGADVNIDWRRLVGFVRDISVVSDAQYQAMAPPQVVDEFPADLQDPRLEFSGLYEDGWVSDHAWASLSQPWNSKSLTFKGYVPLIRDPNFRTEFTVLVDGKEVGRRDLGVGEFEMELPVVAGTGRRRVELRTTAFQRLPVPDQRPVTCRVTLLGFTGADTPPARVARTDDKPAHDAADHPLLSPQGVWRDGWVAGKASLRLAQPPGAGELVVRGMVPQLGDASFATDLTVRVDGQPAGQQSLRLDRFELRVPVNRPEPGVRTVELELSRTQRLPSPDGRDVAFRFDLIGFEPPAGPPTGVRQFPQDLRNPLLNAQGLYEDGWAAPTASLTLTRPQEATELVVKGMVPQLTAAPAAGSNAAFRTELTVLLDGTETARAPLTAGNFDLRIPLPPATRGNAAPCKVELRFAESQTIPAPDGRNVGARLSSIEFTPVSQ